VNRGLKVDHAGCCGIPNGTVSSSPRKRINGLNRMAKRAKTKLAGLDFQGLMDLREEVENALSGYRSTLEKQLASIGGSVAAFGGKVARGVRGSAMKGRKVAAKFKGPDGETWAGRGARPRWLVAAMKEGKKLEDFAIEKTLGTAKKARRKKK
jgi:DNA-binding protein H-NS